VDQSIHIARIVKPIGFFMRMVFVSHDSIPAT
jgi:hypothetical protein